MTLPQSSKIFVGLNVTLEMSWGGRPLPGLLPGGGCPNRGGCHSSMEMDSSAWAWAQRPPKPSTSARDVNATPDTLTVSIDAPAGGLPASNPADTNVEMVPAGGPAQILAPISV